MIVAVIATRLKRQVYLEETVGNTQQCLPTFLSRK